MRIDGVNCPDYGGEELARFLVRTLRARRRIRVTFTTGHRLTGILGVFGVAPADRLILCNDWDRSNGHYLAREYVHRISSACDAQVYWQAEQEDA